MPCSFTEESVLVAGGLTRKVGLVGALTAAKILL